MWASVVDSIARKKHLHRAVATLHFRCECVPHERLGAEKEVGNNTQVSSGKKEEEEEVVVIIIMIEDEINK